MLRDYLPAVVFLLLGGIVGIAFAVLNTYLGPPGGRGTRAKRRSALCSNLLQRGI